MLKNIFQKPKQRVKCIKCGEKEATKDDKMCDSCRYLMTLRGIIQGREPEETVDEAETICAS